MAVAGCVLLTFVVFADVLAREISGTGLHWALEAGAYANLLVVAMGFGLASASGSHLRPRFADRWLPASCEAPLARAGEACMAAFCFASAVLGVIVVAETFALDERSTAAGTPTWLPQSMLPLMFAAGALRHFLYALHPGLRPGQPREPAGMAE